MFQQNTEFFIQLKVCLASTTNKFMWAQITKVYTTWITAYAKG